VNQNSVKTTKQFTDITKNNAEQKLSMKQKSVNNYILHSLSFHLFTSTSSYKSSYTNKSSSSVYKSSYATTMNIFRMKKYNEKFEKEIKNKEDKKNVIKLLFTINIFIES